MRGGGGTPDDWRPVLRGRGLTFTHPRAEEPAVREVSLSVSPGRLLAVAGPNGAGKSTLLRLLSGALAPEAGEVRLDERAARRPLPTGSGPARLPWCRSPNRPPSR